MIKKQYRFFSTALWIIMKIKRVCRRIFLSCVVMLVLFFENGCDLPVDNPDLRLLLRKEGHTLFHPVCSPDGQKVYYLDWPAIPEKWEPYNAGDITGSLWVVGIDGSSDRKLLEGNFGALAISPFGTKLALVTGSEVKGGYLITVDTTGQDIDTIPTSSTQIFDVEFSRDGTKLYYYAGNGTNGKGFYRIGTDGSNEEYIPDAKYFGAFDLTLEDSIYTGDPPAINTPLDYHPQCHPYDPDIVIVRKSDKFIIRNISTGSEDTLHSAEPYWFSFIDYPYWLPDGQGIVYSGGKLRKEGHWLPLEAELWILENVFKYIDLKNR